MNTCSRKWPRCFDLSILERNEYYAASEKARERQRIEESRRISCLFPIVVVVVVVVVVFSH